MAFDLSFIVSIIALIISILALIPIAIYGIQRWMYSPKIIFRVAGEQNGEPIKTSHVGRINFAVSTKSSHKIILSEVFVGFSPDKVDLSKTKGAETRVDVNTEFPMTLLFPEKRTITKKHLQANYFDYETNNSEFLIKFTAFVNVDETEIPHVLDMFAPKKIRVERIVKFNVAKDNELFKKGLRLAPGESVLVEGSQAQEAVWAQSEKDSATVKIHEIVKKSKK